MWYKKEMQTGKGMKSATKKKKNGSKERPTKAKKEFRERR